ncbi:MAG: SMP-30/gluconolactonase/LRE family protein [Candidatus Cybelea sp.]
MRFRLGLLALSVVCGSCSMPPTPISPLAPLAGAGTASSQRAGDAARSVPALSKSQHLLYVANDSFVDPAGPGSVAVYAVRGHDPKLVGELTNGIDGPRNLCLTPDGTLYVPNGNSATIAVYPFGHWSPRAMLTADTGYPTGCAVDKGGNLWVADYANGEVLEFLKGHNKLGTVISGIQCADSVAFDATGDMYVGFGILFCPAGIDVFQPGQVTPSQTITSGLSQDSAVTDIAIGPDGTLYAADAINHDIVVYPRGSTQYSQKITSKTFGVYPLATATGGQLYAGDNFTVAKRNHYIVVEFPRGASSPGRRFLSNHERISDHVRYIAGLAAWPAVAP